MGSGTGQQCTAGQTCVHGDSLLMFSLCLYPALHPAYTHTCLKSYNIKPPFEVSRLVEISQDVLTIMLSPKMYPHNQKDMYSQSWTLRLYLSLTSPQGFGQMCKSEQHNQKAVTASGHKLYTSLSLPITLSVSLSVTHRDGM